MANGLYWTEMPLKATIQQRERKIKVTLPGRSPRCKRRESNKQVSRDESSEIMHKIVRCCTVENNLIGLEGRRIQLHQVYKPFMTY